MAAGRDFERIDVDVQFHGEDQIILIPTAVKMRGTTRARVLERVHAPLSFYKDYQSKLWRQQIEGRRQREPEKVQWAATQIRRVVEDHAKAEAKHILEADLLRTGGALSVLGLDLGAYLGKGYDCRESAFWFPPLPQYPCPVEIKKCSRGFQYQVRRYADLPRAVVLCMTHDMVNLPADIDVVELGALADVLGA